MQRIGFVVFSGYQVMAFAALSVFEFANQQAGRPVYDVRVLSETGGPIRYLVLSQRFRGQGDPWAGEIQVGGYLGVSHTRPSTVTINNNAGLTEMTAGMETDEAAMRFIGQNSPIPRMGFEHELDTALLFLAGPGSTFMTGQSLIVDG